MDKRRNITFFVVLFVYFRLYALEQVFFENDRIFLKKEDGFLANEYFFITKEVLNLKEYSTYFKDFVIFNKNIFLLDIFKNRIFHFDKDRKLINVIKISNILKKPASLFISNLSEIYVTGKNAILKYSFTGRYLSKIMSGRGNDLNTLFNPSYTVIDNDGYYYISDTGNERVIVLNPQKKVVYTLSSDKNMFSSPYGLCFDRYNNLFISDIFRDQILVFDSKLNFKFRFGETGRGNSQFNYPLKIMCDDYNNLYVFDKYNNRIQKFTYNGNFLSEIRLKKGIDFLDVSSFSINEKGDVIFINNKNNSLYHYGTRYFERGREYYKKKDWKKAIFYLKYALSYDKKNQNAAFYLGYCYFKLNEYNISYKYFKKAYNILKSSKCGVYAYQYLLELEKWFNVKKEDRYGYTENSR